MIAPAPRLLSLHVYPVKGCRGFAPASWEIDDFGFRLDRRWMVTDPQGRFISQRSHPRMALIAPSLADHGLDLDAPGISRLHVPVPDEGSTAPVIIWNDECAALDCGSDAATWLSEFLATPCRLVFMPDSSHRPVDPDYGIGDERVSFADGFPFLLATTASLEELNRHLDEPVPMDRFRPNLVVDGAAAFAEDGWRVVRVGAVTFRVVKPCARCVVTTVDQETGMAGREPLRTLSQIRLINGKAMFGQNLIHQSGGRIAAGDPLEVLTTA